MTTAVILLTGGTGKLGESLVRFFAKQDVKVVFTGRSATKINALMATCENAANIKGIVIDHQAPESTRQLIKELAILNLLPTHIINNVRDVENLKVASHGRPSHQAWTQEFYLGVILPYELAMYAISEKFPVQRIINVSSMYGLVAANPQLYQEPNTDSPIHYPIIKAAQNHLTKELAVRLAPLNISVNAVAYGGVEGRVDEAFKARYSKLCPMGRMLKLDEVPGILKYLLLEADAALTGQVIAVDGGWSIW